MGTFATKKILQGNPSLIPVIAEQIKTEFAAEQFEVQIDNLLSGGVDISISKGGLSCTWFEVCIESQLDT